MSELHALIGLHSLGMLEAAITRRQELATQYRCHLGGVPGIGFPRREFAGMNPWYVILEDAYARRDAKTFEMAFTALRAAGLGSRKAFVRKRQKQLDELKAGKK